MSEQDWEPLPDDKVCAHPGELADAAKRLVAPPPAPTFVVAPAPPPPVVAVVPPAPIDPVAAAAIQQLQQRLAAAAPATSLVATVLHEQNAREAKQRRRQRAAQQSARNDALPAPVAAPTAAIAPAPSSSASSPPSSPPQPEPAASSEATEDTVVVDGIPQRDPREDSEWFRGLPPHERQRLHAVWTERRQRVADQTTSRHSWRRNRALAALVTFAAAWLLGFRSAWPATLIAAVVCAFWWQRRPADRFLDPLRAMICFGVAQLAFVLLHDAPNPHLFMDAILLISIAAIVGFDGEIKRSGGFDHQ